MFSKLEKYFHDAAADKKYAGVTFGTIENCEIQTGAIGYSNVALETPIAIDNSCEIASLSKTFTALLLVKMHLSQKLNIDDQIGEYLPQLLNKNVKEITIRELLKHMSGLLRIPSNLPRGNMMNPYNGYSEENLFECLNGLLLNEKEYSYSNLGFAVLGSIITKFYNKKFEEILNDEILLPLEMNNTYVDCDSAKGKKLSTGHLEDLKHQAWWEDDLFIAAGGIKSDVIDLLKYADAYLRPESTPLCNEIKFLINEVASYEDYFVGLSWGVHHDARDTFSHSGATFGAQSLIIFSKEKQKALVILTNTGMEVDVGYQIFKNEDLEYIPTLKCSDKEFLNSICGTYGGMVEEKEYRDVIYFSSGNMFSRAKGQLPFRMHYVEGKTFTILGGECVMMFDIEKQQQTIIQNEKTYTFDKIDDRIDIITW